MLKMWREAKDKDGIDRIYENWLCLPGDNIDIYIL